MNDITGDLTATETALEAAATGFKQMMIVLIVFSAIVTIAIGVIAYKTYQE